MYKYIRICFHVLFSSFHHWCYKSQSISAFVWAGYVLIFFDRSTRLTSKPWSKWCLSAEPTRTPDHGAGTHTLKLSDVRLLFKGKLKSLNVIEPQGYNSVTKFTLLFSRFYFHSFTFYTLLYFHSFTFYTLLYFHSFIFSLFYIFTLLHFHSFIFSQFIFSFCVQCVDCPASV